MSPKPYTDDEILALLWDGRLAKTNFQAAWGLAIAHSKGKTEDLGAHKGLRITIPRPPKRRALRSGEIPFAKKGKFKGKIWFKSSHHGFFFCALTDEEIERLAQDPGAAWKPSARGKYRSFYIDEPQPPLVLTTEGGE